MTKEGKVRFIFLLSLVLIIFVALSGVSATDINLTMSNSTGVLSDSVNINDNGNQSSNDLLVKSDNYSSNYPETLSVADRKTVCNGNAQIASDEVYSSSLKGIPGYNVLYISPSGTGTGSTSEDPTNWDDAYTRIIDGGTIYFTNGNYTSIHTKEISKNLTLMVYDNANVILNANNESFIFYIPNADNSLTLNGLTLINGVGYSDGGYTSGGVIYSMGNLTLINSSFINNTVTSKGGAIYTMGNLTLINSSFINNSAASSGAISVEGDNCEIIGSLFINNTCTSHDGGAISFLNGIISNSSFINNSASNFGGAILVLEGGNCIINQSEFENNTASDGGAIFTYSNIIVNTSIFLDNNATSQGKAIFTISFNYDFENNWWGNNTPFVNGNNLISDGTDVMPNNWIIMSMELNNKSMYSNGRIEVTISLNSSDDTVSDLNLPNRTVYLNTENGLLEFTVANFTNNITDTYTAPNTNGIYEINATIDNQSLSKKVGVIPNSNTYYVNGTYTGNIVDGTKENPFHNISDAVNLANYGNNITIYIMNGTYNDVNMTIINNMTISAYENSTVTLNANKKDHMFDSSFKTIFTVIGLNFINGNSFYGGAISSLGILNVINCNFTNNTASNGGSISCNDISNIVNSSFNYNKADISGAIWSEQCNVINSSFNYNTATQAIGAVGSDEDCNVTSCVFQNNNGGEMGGAVLAGNVNVTGSIFVNNDAKIGKDIYYTLTLSADYNWYGNNTPFSDDNKLIYYEDANRVKPSTYVNATNWVIMTLTSNTTNVNVTDNLTLTVNLNTINSTTGIITDLPINIILPNRTITFTSNYGTFNPKTLNYTNTVKSTYTATNPGTNILYASTDNQILNTPITVNSNVIISPIATSIVNTQLTSYPNGTVTVYIIDGDNIVNTGSVNIFLNNKAIGTAYVHNGQSTINITGVEPGNYNVTIFYFGKEPFDSASKNLPLTILTNNITINIPEIIVKPGINSELIINITDNNGNPINNGNVTVNVDGVNYTSKVVNGSANVNYTTPNTIGLHNISITYTNGNYSTSINSTINVTNMPIATILIGNNLTKNYGISANYTGKLQDTNGNPIIGQHIALNLTRLSDGKNKIYWATTNLLGEYQLPINLSPGEYTIQATFTGNKNYTGSNASINNITILKGNTILTAENFQEPQGAGLNFTGKLTDNQGNPLKNQHISLNLTRLDTSKSKIYWATTNLLGEYQLPINLWTANYTIQCTYPGTNQYFPNNTKATITVTK
jgi:predicted outer membrane repeat protein